MTRKILTLIILLVLGVAVMYKLLTTNPDTAELYPRPQTPPEEITPDPNETNILIKVTNPLPNDIVMSPLIVTGEARGNWYFEANFPVVFIYGPNEQDKVTTYATAQGDWMTEDFVPFTIEIEFPSTTAKTGQLILKKANPSDLPENNNELVVPVKFTATSF